MDEQELRNKFRGALIGVAVGDALGAPFEGMPSVSQILLTQRTAPTSLQDECGSRRYTDDTHMTLGVAESLSTKQSFDGAHMAETFARNYEEEPWRGYGAGPPQVFDLLRTGVPWNQAGQMLFAGAGSYGNGAAMRVAPIALVYYQSVDEMIDVARQSARITHAHELGVQGAVLQALAIALLLNQTPGARISGTAFADLLAARVSAPIYVQQLKLVQELLPDAAPSEVVSKLGNGIEAFQAVPAAIYAFLRHSLSFPEAVRYAISLGGDTDTIASMTGALSGAYLGELAIPVSWRENVEGSDRLCALADDLLELALRRVCVRVHERG